MITPHFTAKHTESGKRFIPIESSHFSTERRKESPSDLECNGKSGGEELRYSILIPVYEFDIF